MPPTTPTTSGNTQMRTWARSVPGPQGDYMWRSTWSSWWKAICAAAGMAGQEFYDLKHRAIQWMVDPIQEGGLGLGYATAAEIVGHDNNGCLIATVYTKLN
ncbi:MAG: hypothetical protein WAN93_13435 [Solirubrobacteraceae bacterium]